MELSLLICTHKRAPSLGITLSKLIGQLPLSFEWEILVVDNANDLATQKVVADYKAHLPVSLIIEKRAGQNSARNAALSSLNGKLIVFTDDDISPKENWLFSLYKASQDNPSVTVFGGKIIPLWDTSDIPWQATAWFSSFVYAHQDLGEKSLYYVDGCFPSSPNMAIRRSVFDEGLKFNTKIGPIGKKRISGSESEFLSRVLEEKQGLYIPEAQVLHRITGNMLKRKYLRKRCYAMGLGMSVWADSPVNEKDIPRMFGIPRYRLGRLIKSTIVMIYKQVQSNTEEAIKSECQAAMDLGFCIGIWTKLKEELTT